MCRKRPLPIPPNPEVAGRAARAPRIAQGITVLKTLLAISLGASLGAIARWLAGLALNNTCPGLPLGTLAVNLVGGFGIGFALRALETMPALAPEWRLFIVTGFLGGLTTFSAFSAEVGSLLLQQRMAAALGGIALHVGGSLVAFFLGTLAFHALWPRG